MVNESTTDGNAMAGSIPTEIGQCLMLKDLVVESNQLTGSVHSHISIGLPIVTNASFAPAGPIPTEIGLLTAMTEFSVSNNQLSGASASPVTFRVVNESTN